MASRAPRKPRAAQEFVALAISGAMFCVVGIVLIIVGVVAGVAIASGGSSIGLVAGIMFAATSFIGGMFIVALGEILIAIRAIAINTGTTSHFSGRLVRMQSPQ